MENLILKLQTLLDEIEHEGLDLTEVNEKLKEIVEDGQNLCDDSYLEEEINF
tara:strand:+ start:408 stop:563 length:156 start_codon:yes stop_codon:yes gene_type:complete